MRPDRGETAGVGLQPGATCPFVGPQGLGSRTRPVLVGTARGGDEKRSIAVSRVGTIHSPARPRLVISPRANVKSWERWPHLGCPSTPCYRRYSVDQMRQSPARAGRPIAIYRQSPRNCDRAAAVDAPLDPVGSACSAVSAAPLLWVCWALAEERVRAARPALEPVGSERRDGHADPGRGDDVGEAHRVVLGVDAESLAPSVA